MLDGQVQYTSERTASTTYSNRGGGALRSDEGGQIRVRVDLGLLSRTLWPYDFWTLTEKELDFIIK